MTSFPNVLRHLLAAIALISPAFAAGSPAPRISLTVDATEAPRKIFHAHMTIPAKPGTLTLYYPKWIPGNTGQPVRFRILPG